MALLLSAIVLVGMSGCSLKRIAVTRNRVYLQADPVRKKPEQQLNVYSTRRHRKPQPVFVFIHGGNWNSGKKETYHLLGKKFAHKNITTVIIDYPLSPSAGYHEMAADAAMAVKWVKDSIGYYGGNPEKIFVSGHSAGGHLAALIAVDDDYFDTLGVANPIQGAILIDAAGLDMYTYLKEERFDQNHTYMRTFGADTTTWKMASPLHYLKQSSPPMLLYAGRKTYASILKGNDTFAGALERLGIVHVYKKQRGKKHIAMIVQYLNSWNPRYREIRKFMDTERR